MTNRFFAFVALLCLVASCSRVPKDIISEKKMRSLLYDMLLAEAIVETNYDKYPTSKEREAVYDAVFRTHRITQAEYDSSLVWYGQNMDLYMQIYKLVLSDVNKSIDDLGEIKPNPLSGDVSAKDSIDVWIFNRFFTFNPNRVFNTLKFSIKPKMPYSSGSSYVLGLSVWGLGDGTKYKPVISINAVQADTIVTVNKEITSDGYYEVVLRTVPVKQVPCVYGYIRIDGEASDYHRIYIDKIRLMKYNYGSKAIGAPRDSTENVDIYQN